MVEIVKTKHDLCRGCNRCVRECPMEVANITYQDDTGNIKVSIDHKKCIACGRCFSVCKHGARYYVDDTERFFADLARGVPISLIAAPAVRTNMPDWQNLFTYLRQLGVRKIYDVSLGADICIWAHIRHLEQRDSASLITQPCPVIVTYCEVYRQDLLKNLSHVHSPMACASIYIKEYEGITDRIAALSPCVAKMDEFEATGLAEYSVTFAMLKKYLEKNKIKLPKKQTGFDHEENGLGALYPMPGGLKENIAFFMGERLSIDQANGDGIYGILNTYAESPLEELPRIFDVLNCNAGCNLGTACSHSKDRFQVNREMDNRRKTLKGNRHREYFEELHRKYDETFNLSHFLREYKPTNAHFRQITDEDIETAFSLLEKTDREKQTIDCGACGNNTCRDMARKIALGVSIPMNCMVKTIDTAKKEHENNLHTLEQFKMIWNQVESGIVIIDAETRKVLDANPAAVRMFGAAKERMIGKICSKFFGQYKCPVLDLNQEINRSEQNFIKCDGTTIPVLKSATKIVHQGRQVILESFADISNMKETEKQNHVMELAERTQAMLDATPLCAQIWDENFNIVDCNQAAIKLFHLSSKQEYLEKYYELTPEFQQDGSRSRDKLREYLQKTLETGYQRLEWMRQTLDGKPLPVEATLVPVNYKDKKLIAGYSRDLREHKQMMQDLDATTEQLESALEKAETAIHAYEAAQSTTAAMLESNPQINILFDSKFQAIECNPAAVTFMGFETKEKTLAGFLSRLAHNIPTFQSDGKPSVSIGEKLVVASKEGNAKFETEIILDGVTRTLDVEFIRIPYENNFGVVAYVIDMTAIHKREMELTRVRELNELQLAKLGLVVKATKIGLWDMEVEQSDPIGPNNAFTWSNEVRSMLGCTDKTDFPDILGSWSDRLHPDDKEAALDTLLNHLRDTTGQTSYEDEYRLRKKSGRYAYYRASGETIRNENGRALRIAGAIIDITETKNLLFDTEKQRQEAEAANQAKSAFLSTVSHEIRTPMNAILGITEIQLQNEALDSDVRDGFEKIYAFGDMLLGIINDILDLSKIEASKMELNITDYEIASLISDITQLNLVRIGSKPIEFKLHVDENLPAILLGDELRVKQVFNNILSNAFKYTEKGTVVVFIYAEPGKTDDEITLVVSVKDTGQGMTKEQIGKLFDKYSRFNPEANRTTEGTGLGMNIARNLIRMMNGRINVKSTPGKGSTFIVHLPQGKVNSDILGKESAENLRKFHTSGKTPMKRGQIVHDPMPYGSVLIVDDMETNILVAEGLLALYEIKTDSVDSGYGAIEKIQNGRVYDIIFMDHMMPKMDGVQTTKILRELGYSHPIIALTANAVGEHSDVFRTNGFDGFISKPIDVRQLNTVLTRLIRDKFPPEIVEAAKRTKKELPPENTPELAINPQIAEIFLRDANKTFSMLDEFMKKSGPVNKEEMRLYISYTHGIKNALTNIGQTDLSTAAAKLETAGRERKFEIIASKTPPFIDSLRAFIKKLTPKEKATVAVDEDRPYLMEKLLVIKATCEEYDEKTAETVLAELRAKAWSKRTEELLAKIAEQLLCSEFEEIVDAVKKFVEEPLESDK